VSHGDRRAGITSAGPSWATLPAALFEVVDMS